MQYEINLHLKLVNYCIRWVPKTICSKSMYHFDNMRVCVCAYLRLCAHVLMCGTVWECVCVFACELCVLWMLCVHLNIRCKPVYSQNTLRNNDSLSFGFVFHLTADARLKVVYFRDLAYFFNIWCAWVHVRVWVHLHVRACIHVRVCMCVYVCST